MPSKFKTLNWFNIVLILLALIQYYLLTPLNTPAETYINLGLALDTKIKLIPGFLIFYYSVYVLLIFLFVSIVRKKEAPDLTVFLMAILILWSLINFCHGFLPTNNSIRPEITESNFFFDVLKSLYTKVKPFRTLPDWHVATAVLCAIAFFKMKFRKPVFIIVWCVLIILSPIFLKMAYIIDAAAGILLGFVSFALAGKISTYKMRTESVQEIVKAFTLESLVQSIAIGIRDESTLSALVDGLTRVEKNLTEKDKVEIKSIGSQLHNPVQTLKEVINNIILSINVDRHLDKAREIFGKNEKSYMPSDKDLKQAAETLVSEACMPFDDPKFRFSILEIKKKNSQLINTNSIEEAAKERSEDVIFRFNSFLESHRKDIPVINTIATNNNGHLRLSFDEIKIISRELRKPPYEITTDEVWNAFYRIDSTKVRPIGEQKNPANIIALTQFALGKIEILEPYGDKVEKKFNEWIEENKVKGKEFSGEELEWLKMMKNYFASFLEINMTSFNQPPFVNKGGASKAYNIFGHDLNKILYELNENLV